MPNKGFYEAKRLIEKYYITQPNEIPIEDIILSEGPYVYEKEIRGAEGRIICYEDHAIITVNSFLKDINKKRFVLAHELGHFELHRELNAYYSDNENNFWEWKNDKIIESEANEFAAELLMPTEIFLSRSKKEKFSIDFIQRLSDVFITSLTSTAIRFAEKGHDPILLICSKNNIIKWYIKNDSFPFVKVNVHKNIPINTVTYEYYSSAKTYDRPEEIDPKFWNIFNPYFSKLKYYEQCLYFNSYNYVLTFIWLSD
jgi:hypothetical protein